MDTKAWGARCAIAAALALAGAGTGVAQDEDPELKKLRESADSTVEDATKKPDRPLVTGVDEAQALREQADSAVEEDRGWIQRAIGAISERGNEFNPRMTVIADMLGRLATNREKTVDEGTPLDDRFAVREIELDLRAAIDPYSKGVVILAFEEESPGEYHADVEEAYFTLEQLPYQFKLKAGRFRVPFGRMNAIHTHDLPHSTAPYAVQDLFGHEGYRDNGAILSWLAPLPIPVELSGLVLSGQNDRVLYDGVPSQPAYLGRAEVFFQLTDVTWASLGGSYLYGHTDVRGTPERPKKPHLESQVAELDLLVKWQPNQFKSVVFIAEAYRLIRRERMQSLDYLDGGVDADGNPTTSPIVHHQVDRATGVFGMLQVQADARWYFGVRADWSDFDDGRPGHRQWAASAWVSLYVSEFLRFRVGFEHRERLSQGGTDRSFDPTPNDTLFFQVTWVFGSHPVEPFWVNK